MAARQAGIQPAASKPYTEHFLPEKASGGIQMNEENLMETYQDGKVVFDGRIIRVEHWTVKLPNGNLALREVACHPGASAVVALDEMENIILVRQYRAPIGRLTLEIPAGKFDHAGEDPLVCAQRELSEETGLLADSWRKLTVLENE